MAIEENLRKIQEARYGREVRDAIHDAIHECYEDGRAGATDLIAREQIATERTVREIAVAGAMSAITAEQAARAAAVTAEENARTAAVTAEENARAAAVAAEQAAREAAVANLESIKADKTQLASPFNFKGSCLFAELPTSGNEVNDTYYVTDMTSRYSWNGTAWYQSGMSEADYTDALAAVETAVQNLEDGVPGTITGELKEDLANLTYAEKSVNLYDASKRTVGMALNNRGEAVSPGSYDTSDYIEVEYGKEYKIGCYSGASLLTNGFTCRFIAEYDADKNFISPIINGNNLVGGIYTPVSTNAKYIRFSIGNAQAYECNLYDILALSLLFPAEYIPYFYAIKIKDSALSDTMQGLPARVTALENEPSPTPSARKRVVYWGDSLTFGNQDGTGVTRATVMQSLLGDEWTVKNFGSGGEQSNTIACRQGGLNLLVAAGQTIPASGTVNLEITDNEGNAVNLRSSVVSGSEVFESVNPCFIAGVEGSLSYVTLGTSPYKFTRSGSGEAIEISRPTGVVTNAMRNYVNDIVIIEIGQNGGYADADALVRQIKQMLDINHSEKYLVCGFVTSGKNAQNTAMKNAFGRHFIDVMEYASTPIYGSDGETIVSCYGLDDMNLSMTETDLARIQDRLMPKSLQVESDNIHLNQYGYTMQARLEYKRGKELGYW